MHYKDQNLYQLVTQWSFFFSRIGSRFLTERNGFPLSLSLHRPRHHWPSLPLARIINKLKILLPHSINSKNGFYDLKTLNKNVITILADEFLSFLRSASILNEFVLCVDDDGGGMDGEGRSRKKWIFVLFLYILLS